MQLPKTHPLVPTITSTFTQEHQCQKKGTQTHNTRQHTHREKHNRRSTKQKHPTHRAPPKGDKHTYKHKRGGGVGNSRVLGQRLHTTQTLGQGEHLEILQECLGAIKSPLDEEGHHTTKAMALLLGNFVLRVRLETCIQAMKVSRQGKTFTSEDPALQPYRSPGSTTSVPTERPNTWVHHTVNLVVGFQQLGNDTCIGTVGSHSQV